ncbi:MAG: hypothetical protein WC969_09415 [Elusimicrobiota bacterium]|jgi:hypothetical protein
MKTFLGVLLASLLASALRAADPAPAAPPAAPAPYWLKSCPRPERGGIWHVELRVQDLPKRTGKVYDALKRNGCDLTQPLANFPLTKDGRHQQLSCRIPRTGAEKALLRLRRLGEVVRLERREEDPAPSVECSEKLARLKADRDAEKLALARAPAVSALVDETAASLEASARAYTENKDILLLNLALDEARP